MYTDQSRTHTSVPVIAHTPLCTELGVLASASPAWALAVGLGIRLNKAEESLSAVLKREVSEVAETSGPEGHRDSWKKDFGEGSWVSVYGEDVEPSVAPFLSSPGHHSPLPHSTPSKFLSGAGLLTWGVRASGSR